MCARRFLGFVFVLTLLVVAGAFAIYQWGGNVLLKSATPQGHFEAAAAGSGPDYTKLESWLCHPTVFGPGKEVRDVDDPCRREWTGPNPEPGLKPQVATFYVHPTTYLERDQWNAPVQPGGQTEFRTRLFATTQASIFEFGEEVWAPRYRQAAYGSFLLDSEDAKKALNLAYSDVAAAFDEFVRQIPQSEPIILAGHSQGALHVMRLLKDKIAGRPIARRLIAAYIVGWPISTKADLPALGLPSCHSRQETNCILSWMSFREPANPSLILQSWEKTKGLNGARRRQDDLLCVNPITGTQDGADLRGIGGIVVPSADPNTPTMNFNSLGAHCDRGLLIIDGELPPLGPYVLPGNNYHVYDYALFYGAIGQDALGRVMAWHR